MMTFKLFFKITSCAVVIIDDYHFLAQKEKDIASNIPADEDNDNCDSSSNDSISLAQIVLNR